MARARSSAKGAPRALEWRTLSPGTLYPCHRWEDAWLGRTIPGRGGGVVTSCATPLPERPREGLLAVQHPGGGVTLFRRNTAKLRVRDKTRFAPGDPVELIEQRIAHARKTKGTTRYKPGAPGLEFPHRAGASECEPEHPLWHQLDDQEETIAERLAIELPEDLEQLPAAERRKARERYRADVVRTLRTSPVWGRAVKAEERCTSEYERRKDKREASRGANPAQREQRQRRAAFIAAGGDPTSAEYLEMLSPSTRAKRYRGMGQAALARSLEAQRSGKGGGRGSFQP